MTQSEIDETDRPGEIRSSVDPAAMSPDAGVIFIGRARTPWTDRHAMPKNVRQARESRRPARIEIDAPWRPGLMDLAAGSAVEVLTWLDRARRDLVVQAPRHGERLSGVFSLRSPVRPNPIGLHIVRLLSCDAEAGVLTVDALDCLDGTPVLDIKPWLASVDVPPEIEA
ncbi:MAG: tRNA (N6-threonylcarbamoyladenosine(37)-N6)-methyltransferase TrmO [Propylenella sp.]